jgi:hypothetical protein
MPVRLDLEHPGQALRIVDTSRLPRLGELRRRSRREPLLGSSSGAL